MRPNPVIAHISEYIWENTVFLQAPGPLFQTAGSRCKPWTMEVGRSRGECMECLSSDGRECLFTTSLDIHIREVKSLWVRSRWRGLFCALVQCFAIVVFLHDCQRTQTQGLGWETTHRYPLLSVYALAQNGDSMLPWILIHQKWRNTSLSPNREAESRQFKLKARENRSYCIRRAHSPRVTAYNREAQHRIPHHYKRLLLFVW